MRNTRSPLMILSGLLIGSVLFLALTPGDVRAEKEAEDTALLEKAQDSFKWENEELYYKIKINDTEAAHAVIRIGEVRLAKGQPYVPLSAKAKSVGLFDSIYPMDDRANTFLSPMTFRPLRAEKFFKEAGKARTYEVDYDHDNFSAKVHKIWHKTEKTPKEKERTYTRAIPGLTFDAFSWFFDLRAKEDFKPDEVHSYYIDDGWKLNRVDLTVVGEERVLTPMGWFTSTRFDFTREELKATHKKSDGKNIEPSVETRKEAKPFGSVWLSNDSRRIPVKVQVVSTLGTGEVFLAKYIKPSKSKKKSASEDESK